MSCKRYTDIIKQSLKKEGVMGNVMKNFRSAPWVKALHESSLQRGGLSFGAINAGYSIIPPETLDELEGWTQLPPRIEPSRFVRAVLSNDLYGAYVWASERQRVALYWIVAWLHNNAPCLSWGSPEAVAEWGKLTRKG
jgi:hypothetical protein